MTASDPTGQIYLIFNSSRFLRDTNDVKTILDENSCEKFVEYFLFMEVG